MGRGGADGRSTGGNLHHRLVDESADLPEAAGSHRTQVEVSGSAEVGVR